MKIWANCSIARNHIASNSIRLHSSSHISKNSIEQEEHNIRWCSSNFSWFCLCFIKKQTNVLYSNCLRAWLRRLCKSHTSSIEKRRVFETHSSSKIISFWDQSLTTSRVSYWTCELNERTMNEYTLKWWNMNQRHKRSYVSHETSTWEIEFNLYRVSIRSSTKMNVLSLLCESHQRIMSLLREELKHYQSKVLLSACRVYRTWMNQHEFSSIVHAEQRLESCSSDHDREAWKSKHFNDFLIRIFARFEFYWDCLTYNEKLNWAALWWVW
jgi:hypothetical protein